jgi:putative photosynthetic complex assembly protein
MSATTVPMISSKPFAIVFVALALTVLAIGGMRLSGYQPPKSIPQQPADAVRLLQAKDTARGIVVISDATTGEEIKTFKSGEGSFVRAILRALVNDRRHKGLSLAGNFRLERHNGQLLFLIDEATGRTLSLNAFGPSNTAVFAAFMPTKKG